MTGGMNRFDAMPVRRGGMELCAAGRAAAECRRCLCRVRRADDEAQRIDAVQRRAEQQLGEPVLHDVDEGTLHGVTHSRRKWPQRIHEAY